MVKIGLEIHCQLNTKSKIFCGCSTASSEEPNTIVCQVCLGHPGSKPVLNKAVLEKAIKVGKALGCKVANKTYFSRKTYFYPDLAKDFQITQYEIPILGEGMLEGIRIRRIHLEEDPGRLVHEANGCLIDYNRSGIPLIEIVTEPDFTSVEQIRKFMNKLIRILEYLDVYERESELTMRTDANVSINEGERVEIKNIGGVKDLDRALGYEIERQKREGVTEQHTRRWDGDRGVTEFIRSKETEDDYGYILEPDLAVIELSQEEIDAIKIPELSDAKVTRFSSEYGLTKEEADVLASDMVLSYLYERVAKSVDKGIAARWLVRDFLRFINDEKINLKDFKINETHLIELLSMFEKGKITDNVCKKILRKLIKERDFSPSKYVESEGLTKVSDASALGGVCKEVVKENQKAVDDFKAGNEKSIHFLVGQVMRRTKGASNPDVVKGIIEQLIK